MPYVILTEEEVREHQWRPLNEITLADGRHTVGKDQAYIPIQVSDKRVTILINEATCRLEYAWCPRIDPLTTLASAVAPHTIIVDELTLRANPPYPGGESDDFLDVSVGKKRYILVWRDS